MRGTARTLKVNARSAKGRTRLSFTEQAVSFTERMAPGMDDVPDLVGMMLGTALDYRRRARNGWPERQHGGPDWPGRPGRWEEGWQAIEVPYTSIIRCFLARPGRPRHAKLAFDWFDARRGRVVSREFLLDRKNVGKVEILLSSLVPDRLEVH